jgi:hypothetical protein
LALASAKIAVIKSAPWPQAQKHLADILTAQQKGINIASAAAGVTARGQVPTPTTIGSISVLGGAGTFDIAIVDGSASTSALAYTVQYDTNPNFTSPHQIPLGPNRNVRSGLGAVTLYFRASSKYPGGGRSPWITFGSPATPVSAGGSTPPPLQKSQGVAGE